MLPEISRKFSDLSENFRSFVDKNNIFSLYIFWKMILFVTSLLTI
jgi:hypothetical protein